MQSSTLPATLGRSAASPRQGNGHQPVVTEAWGEPGPQPPPSSSFLPDIREGAHGSRMSNRQANSIFTLTTDVPSPEALRGEARIRGLKNELQTVKNHYAQELQVRASLSLAPHRASIPASSYCSIP